MLCTISVVLVLIVVLVGLWRLIHWAVERVYSDKGETFIRSSKRMLLFSDTHMYESQDPLHSELAGKNSGGEKIIAKSMRENENKFMATLQRAKRFDDAKFIFFGGDSVTGWGERGLIGPDSLDHIDKFKKLLNESFAQLPKKYMAGGHEVGYVLPLSTDPKGGISEKSVQVFEQNFNELFYTFTEGRHKFVVLSSDLELFQGDNAEILQRKKAQTDFYCAEIACTKENEKIVLMLHDPDALIPMFPFLRNNLQKIERTFCGHQHAQWVNSIYPILCKFASSRLLEIPLKPIFDKFFPNKADAVWQYFCQNKNNAGIWQALKVTIIPAPGGMLGIGGGFLVADLFDNEIIVRKPSKFSNKWHNFLAGFYPGV